jgi:CRP/FNR family cyclic AMP-dependent transcriptional regulator
VSEDGGTADAGDCVPDRIEALGRPAWGTRPPPWAPGWREEAEDMEHSAEAQPHGAQRLALLAKIDILADLTEPEVN